MALGVPKELQALVKDAQRQGWVVLPTNANHLKWVSPMGSFFFSASTPSDYRALKNIKRDLIRCGFIEITKKKGKR